MTDLELQKLIDDMRGEWGDRMPNPEHFPQTFLYYVKVMKYLQEIRKPV